jgi:hypothetical protein
MTKSILVQSCYPNSLNFCRFGRASDSSSPGDSSPSDERILTMLGTNYRDTHVRGWGMQAPLKVSMS